MRIDIEGPAPDKERGERLKGVIKRFVREWLARKRRQHAPASSGSRGAQGPVPQRVPTRDPGPLVQIVPLA